MSKQIDIRHAQPHDEAAVRKCAEDAYAQYVAAIGKRPAPMGSDFAALIASDHVHVAVDADACVIGFIVFYQKGDYIFLDSIAVRPDATGLGIGKQLVAFCEAAGRRSNAKSVKLYTNEKMTANLSIYPHLGYRETDRKREDGYDRVYFEKAI